MTASGFRNWTVGGRNPVTRKLFGNEKTQPAVHISLRTENRSFQVSIWAVETKKKKGKKKKKEKEEEEEEEEEKKKKKKKQKTCHGLSLNLRKVWDKVGLNTFF